MLKTLTNQSKYSDLATRNTTRGSTILNKVDLLSLLTRNSLALTDILEPIPVLERLPGLALSLSNYELFKLLLQTYMHIVENQI